MASGEEHPHVTSWKGLDKNADAPRRMSFDHQYLRHAAKQIWHGIANITAAWQPNQPAIAESIGR